jgi:hypothetical protein
MRVLFFVLLLGCSSFVRAENIVFVVYYTKGTIAKNSGGPFIKKGDKLFEKDNISLSAGSQVVLICRNHSAIKLTGKGKYAIKNLMASCDQKSASFTSSYFSYVWEEMTHEHGLPEDDPTHYMKNTGAVSRGCNSVETKLPVDTVILSTGILPVYYITTIPDPYITVFKEAEEGETLLSLQLENQPLILDSIAIALESPGTYYWQITDKNGEGCERNVLKVVSPKEYYTSIAQLLRELPPATPAESAYMKAFILEENHFLAEAFKFYKQAYKLSPSNKTYQFAQSRFYE